jgi:predicted enzyme related to lactoylglutathione lyase
VIDAGTYGAVNWIDLSTNDIRGAIAFYEELLGWEVGSAETPMGEYFVGSIDEREIAGMMQQAPDLDSPPVWTTFVYVEDIDDTVAKVESAGGRVLEPPFDIPGDARVSVVADPTGGMFALITGPRPSGPYFSGHPGFVCWVELLTRDTAAAEGFYASVLGWKTVTDPATGYSTFELDGEQIAGMLTMPAEVPAEAPAHWGVYFSVADCSAAERTAAELGGQVLRPTTEIEIGKFAVLADPQNAKFSVMEFIPAPQP